jgi:hypothetical protein
MQTSPKSTTQHHDERRLHVSFRFIPLPEPEAALPGSHPTAPHPGAALLASCMRGPKMRKLLLLAAVGLAIGTFMVLPATTGEWHSSNTGTNLCTDCHTMHFSQTHNWDGTTPVPSTPAANGNWLGATGPNNFLLKLPANQLCLSCHDGQTFAPDVMGVNTNASPTQGRSAGALNEVGLGGGYDAWKGHTLAETAAPPGYNPAVVGLSPTWYTGTTDGLECIHCHTQHGIGESYRNLGPRNLASSATARASYVLGSTNDATRDVWINTAGYTANSGSAATFNPYYDNASVSYNRNDRTVGTTQTSNGVDTMCASCHGNFHGGPNDTTIANGTTIAGLDGFIRHPTGGIVLGAAGAAGYGGHSSLTRFVAATTKVKVYSDAPGYTDATPGCVTCHKAHGNQNPFGLVFLNRDATSVGEQGGYAASGYGAGPEPANGYQVGYRNLCGQCHGQGN